jgi:putative transposase
VALTLIYQMFAKLLGWMVLRARSDTAKDIEILVLRHQLTVLHRRTPRLRISWTDRAVIAVLARLLPARRRVGLLVTPSTILRWHRQLIARRWTTPHTRPGRPAIPTGVRALIVRLATENPTWGYRRVRREALIVRVGVRDPRVSQFLLIMCRRRPMRRGRPGFLAGWPAQGMGCEIWRR